MHQVLRNTNPATASETTPAKCVRVSSRRTTLLRAASGTCVGLCILLLSLGATNAEAQDSSAGSSQSSEPVVITPAPSNPSYTPVEPLFPQTTVPSTDTSARSSPRYSVPTGPALGAGLGYGPLRPGDIVDVQVFEAPEYSTRMPVSPAGEIALPYVGLFHIEGMTSIEAGKAIASFLDQQQVLRDPRVIVTTQQFGYSVTVLGEVKSPGIYALAGNKRLLDMLTEAGGVTDRAGHVIEIFAPGSIKDPQTILWDPTLRENDNAELPIKTGETILVSRCGVVYIGGNVGRPGAFPICESNHTTLSQVIALAQGTKPSSWTQKTLLLRTTGNGTRVVQTIKLDDVLRGRKVDITLQPDDILFVPPSILKAAGKTALTAAVGFATQALFYVH